MITNILKELKSTTSRNEKIQILENNKTNINLFNILKYTYDKTYQFGIKEINAHNITHVSSNQESLIISLLIDILENDYGSNSKELNNVIDNVTSQLDSEMYNLLKCIFDRDLQCGISMKTIEKVYPELKKHQVSLCNVLNEKTKKYIKFPCYVQTNYDGARCYHKVDGKTVQSYSRNNKPVVIGAHVSDTLLKYYNEMNLSGTYYFDSEALYSNDVSRKSSNGYFNKLVRNTATTEERNNFMFVVWDCYCIDDDRTYEERLTALIEHSYVIDKHVVLPVTKLANTFDEIYKYNDFVVNAGGEGIIIKNKDWLWEGKRSNSQLKVKCEKECELVVVSVNEGIKSRSGKLGSLTCQTADGLLEVNVSGFDESQQKEYFTDDMVGQIVTVRYNEIISKRTGGKYSLFLPRFITLRLDKNEANTLSEVKELWLMTI